MGVSPNSVGFPQFTLSKINNEHKSCVYSVIVLKDGQIASCSYDKTIKIFDPKTLRCKLNYKKFYDGILSICQLDNGKLVTSSHIIEVFDYKNHSKEKVDVNSYSWHNKVITLTNKRFATCSEDRKIEIFSQEPPYKCIKKLKGHSHYVRSIIQLKDKEIDD